MKVHGKLILSASIAFVIAVIVIFTIVIQSSPMTFNTYTPYERVEQHKGGVSTDMTDASENRVTMLRGFAYTLGRRYRAWRKVPKK